MKKIKTFILLTFLFILFCTIQLVSYANNISNDLSNTFFRLHIIANSDSKEDQELKLKVRDEIISYMNNLNYKTASKEEIKELSIKNSNELKKIAKKVISDNGYNYNVEVKVGNFNFPTKYYGNISLPAGNYDALRIEIGDAKGQNWWCSLFPPLCFVDISSGVIDEKGTSYLKNTLTPEEFEIITNDSRDIKIKFKIIEMLNSNSK